MAKNTIKTYKKDLYEPKYYLMKNPGKYIVNMYSSFILDDKKLEDTNLYKYIESIKINKNKLTEAIYKINQLEDRRKKNQYLKNISTFSVWKILDYVRNYHKCNLDTIITLDQYYNMERYIITKIDCNYGYYMPVEESTKQEIYDIYPSTVISSGTQNSCIYSKYRENEFEREPQYFETGNICKTTLFSNKEKKELHKILIESF